MDYRRLFDRLKCYIFVVFDDEFVNNKPSKKHIVHDFVVMDLEDQDDLVARMHEQNDNVAYALKGLADEINPIFSQIDWKEEVLLDDFESAFPVIEKKVNPTKADEIRRKYEAINETELISQFCWLAQYGLCVLIPSCYRQIIEQYDADDGRRSKLRIYSDFTASTKEQFEKNLQQASDDKTIICVIDNCLQDDYKAQEILDCISAMGENNANVIGTVFTSKETIERIDEHLCFVCTNKAEVNQLSMNIVRSAYHYFLKRLQSEIAVNVNDVFKKAKESKYIANHLSQRAVHEGISDYEVMQNWIRLMYEVQSAKSNAAKRLISLAQIVDELEDDDKELALTEVSLLDDLNTWEIFDYRVNDYHLPPMPGDVYVTDDNKVYILIGQDCEMMMAAKRKRKVPVAELLPVESIIPMSTPDKISNDMKYVWIAHYKHIDDQVYCMKIDYTKRKCIDGRILDLCVYDSAGRCSVASQIDDAIKDVLQTYLIGYHKKLQEYFTVIEKLQESNPDDLNAILYNEQYLIAANEYRREADEMRFPIRRICRLKQTYVFFLYKLYLEHRGRQPFETINYAASLPQSVEVNYADKSYQLDIAVKLGGYSYDDRIHKLPWFVKREKMCAMLKAIGIHAKIASDDSVFALFESMYDIELQDGKKVRMTKRSGHKASICLIN